MSFLELSCNFRRLDGVEPASAENSLLASIEGGAEMVEVESRRRAFSTRVGGSGGITDARKGGSIVDTRRVEVEQDQTRRRHEEVKNSACSREGLENAELSQ